MESVQVVRDSTKFRGFSGCSSIKFRGTSSTLFAAERVFRVTHIVESLLRERT